MNLFRRGRHRRNRWSITVAELVAESKRIPIADVFALIDQKWDARKAEMTRLVVTRDAATDLVTGAR